MNLYKMQLVYTLIYQSAKNRGTAIVFLTNTPLGCLNIEVANIILNDFPMGSAKKLGVTNKNLSISPIGLLIMTRSLIFIWQKCHGVGNFDWVLYLAVKSKLHQLFHFQHGSYPPPRPRSQPRRWWRRTWTQSWPRLRSRSRYAHLPKKNQAWIE